MKKVILLLLLLNFIVVGCQKIEQDPKEENLRVEEKMKNPESEKNMQALITSKQSFHFVVDWLSEEEIVYVQLKDGVYHIVSYNIYTKEQRDLYKESAIVADVLIHPSKEYLLLHTSEDDHSATVKMVDLNGQQIYEVNIESNELDIQWNDLEPRHLLLTAFYEDWTYDHYFYSGFENDLSLIHLPYPFPQWIGEEELIMFQGDETSLLEGKQLEVMNVVTADVRTGIGDVLSYDTYKRSLLAMIKLDDSTARFLLMDEQFDVLYEWESPLVSNYSEWVIPEVFWLSNERLLTYVPSKEGLLDDLTEGFKLVKINRGVEEVLEGQVNMPLRCSSDQTYCLTGPSFNQIKSLSDGKVERWLLFEE